MRFEDSPDLFGCGSGTSTDGNITCDFCGSYYGGREDENEEPLYDSESIRFTSFAGKQVCECCFEKIEVEVFNRMEDIVTWFRDIIDTSKHRIKKKEDLLKAVEEEFQERTKPTRIVRAKKG